MKLMDMRVHVWLREVGCVKGITFIIDMTGSSIRHLHKLGYFNGRKALSYMLEGLPVRLRAVHIVHPTNFVDAVFTIVHPLISAELRSNVSSYALITTFISICLRFSCMYIMVTPYWMFYQRIVFQMNSMGPVVL